MEVFLRAKIMSMALDIASAVTTRLQPTGSPSDPPRTSRVRIESLRLRLPVSQRGSEISRRTVMNHTAEVFDMAGPTMMMSLRSVFFLSTT